MQASSVAAVVLTCCSHTLSGRCSVRSRGRHEHVPLQPLRFQDKFFFWAGKVVHFGLTIGVPVYFHGWSALLYFYLPTELCGGFSLASVFAVSHNAEVTAYNLPRDMVSVQAALRTGCMRVESARRRRACVAPTHCLLRVPPNSLQDWAETQIRTSCNWGPNSKLWLYAVGGLNFQIEHHLFPGVAHIHYPAISKIVKRVCAKRDIPYGEYNKFRSLYASHLKTLYKLGHYDSLEQADAAAAKKGN